MSKNAKRHCVIHCSNMNIKVTVIFTCFAVFILNNIVPSYSYILKIQYVVGPPILAKLKSGWHNFQLQATVKNPMSLDDDEHESSFKRAIDTSSLRPDIKDNSNGDSILVLDSEPMFSLSYDPLEPPNQLTLERDLEDFLMERALRFLKDKASHANREKCYLVGLDDKSLNERGDCSRFTMEESLTELSELAGAAGLHVIGSTYQRVQRPNLEYYIGPGKLKDVARVMSKNKCTCVIFDVELTPSQQKNLELSFNQESRKDSKERIKVIDRTALILDIFAQHARTKEGQLQVQLALLTYRLPRLTNMWTHLERQSAGARGRSNGGVGLRGPGEKQLESDRRQMKSKIALLNRAIDSVRRHRSMHRRRRRRLGLPVVALVGYTNAGKSTLLNSFTSAGVFVADMLFATLDPTTRLVRVGGLRNPDILLTDTVGFIQKLPTNLVAAFRATLEEISEADVLLHVTDISNEAWRKQEAAVLRELADMGLADKPIVTVWNKIDMAPDRKEFLKFEARKRAQTVAVSSVTGEGLSDLTGALEGALSSRMEPVSATIPYGHSTLLNSLHSLGILDEVQYQDEGIYVRGKVPLFLLRQIEGVLQGEIEGAEEEDSDEDYGDYDFEEEEEGDVVRYMGGDEAEEEDGDDSGDAWMMSKDFDWSGLAKGRHDAVRVWEDMTMTTTTTVTGYSTSTSTSESELTSGSLSSQVKGPQEGAAVSAAATAGVAMGEKRKRLQQQRQRRQKQRQVQAGGQFERRAEQELKKEGSDEIEEGEEEHWTTLRLMDFDNGEYHTDGDNDNDNDSEGDDDRGRGEGLEDSAQKQQKQQQQC